MLYFFRYFLSLFYCQNSKEKPTLEGAAIINKKGKFEIFKDKSDKYRFRLKAKNGEIILSSQSYVTKGATKSGIESVKKNAPCNERYKRKVAKDKKPMFNLVATNKQVIGTSEQYESTIGRENGVESVKENAPSAEIVDLT